MGQLHHPILSAVGRWRLGVWAWALWFVAIAPGWGAAAATPAALAADSPEQIARESLRAYLAKTDAKRFDSSNAQNLDHAQALARIRELEQSNRAAELTDAYLLYLTKFDPDPKDYLDIFSKLVWLVNQRGSDSPLLTLAFSLTDHFPSAALPAQQIHLSEAEYLLHFGLVEPALVLLHQLVDLPGVAPQVRMVAAGRAGFLHERLGQTDYALEAYLKAGEDLAVGSQANEAQLRAGLLLLELGRTDEGLAAIVKLKGVPPEVMLTSPAAPAINELVELTSDPARARAYWSHQEQWQPAWNALAARLGVKPGTSGDPLLTPYIDSYQQIATVANAALTQKDAPDYFELVRQLLRAGHWRPGDLAAAADLLYKGLPLAPEHADEIFALGAAFEQGLPSSLPGLIAQLTQSRAAALVDAGKPEVARDAVAAVLAKYGSTGAGGQALARLYGFAVLKSNSPAQYQTEAARILAETFTDPAAHGNQRALAVLVLSELYLALGREDEAQALLEKELSALPPAQPNDPAARYQTVLRDKLSQLRMRHALAQNLEAGLKAWWSQHPLPWYQYVNSSSQSGSLSTVEDPAVQIARQFARALDASAPLSARAAALQQAWNPYPDMPLSGPALVDATSAFAARADLPVDLRAFAWTKAMWHLLWTGQRPAAAKLFAAAPDGVSADDRADFDLWIEYLNQPTTVAAQQAFADKTCAMPALRQYSVLLVLRVVDTLAHLGAFDAAQATFQKLGTAKLDDAAAQQYRQLTGYIGTLLQTYQGSYAACEALRALVLQARPQEAAAAQVPQSWRDLNNIWDPNLALLTQEDVRQGLLAVIRDRLSYGRHPLQIFLDYGQALSFNAADNALRFRIFETAQRLATNDDDRFYAALFTSMVDFDDPGISQRGWADLASARAAAYPKAAGFLQYYDTLMKWRGGDAVDMTEAFGPLNAPGIDPYRLRLAMDYYLQHNDRAALEKLLQSRPEQDFLHMPILSSYLKALRLLGKQAALTRAVDAAQLELAKDVVQSWAHPGIEGAEPVFEISRALGGPPAYPRDWIAAELANVRNENSRDLVQLADARLQHDWRAALAAADSYLARNPTSYDAYWPRAEALIQLGRKQEALAPLRTYLKYSHNEDEYLQAQEWLKKIEAEAGQPPAAAATVPAPPVK